jgi:predicted acylesterase/phospholipase RssA/CRP-like cAMP-binding protein
MIGNTEPQARLVQVLRASGVFGSLPDPVLSQLADALQVQHVSGGTRVLREGADSDSMLFVLSGRLRVSRQDIDGSLLLYNEIRVGESVGETGMILHQPRTADVTAVRDSTLAILRRTEFEALLADWPLPLNRVFSQAIYNHLRHTPQVIEGRHAQSFAVVPMHPGARADEVARSLTKALAAMGRVHHLTPQAEKALDSTTAEMRRGIDRHQALEDEFDFLVYEAEARPTTQTLRAFRQADQVIYVAAGDAPCEPGELETLLADEPGSTMKRNHLVLWHPADTPRPGMIERWRTGRSLERIYPLRSKHVEDYARVARFLTGHAVGLVLGGGGARGFAHLGVLKALEEAKIPIDLIGGNSMGALIGAQYACGWSLDEIREQTQKFAGGGEWPTLPVISLVSGKRVQGGLKKMFGDIEFDSLWRPFFAAACNLSQARTSIQDSGPLWRAVLASNSPAGLLPPVLHDGDLLVDGAILENVPVSAMRVRLGTPLEKRRGNGTIIAVDVDVRQDMGVDRSISRLSVRNHLKSLVGLGTPGLPGISDILYRAGHIGGLHQRAHIVAQADYYLEPPVGQFALMAYRRAVDISDVGYRYAMEAIEKWDRQTLPR